MLELRIFSSQTYLNVASFILLKPYSFVATLNDFVLSDSFPLLISVFFSRFE
ncbi:hypothetical protein MtrunA17_Chr3g0099701 [Medicago truncatula]|uniref:Uncharacterized protein n=1 Tax=Medicago truncatula TaxID=3880 RepID=A0A396IR70_MEDTR|nr:hypothetical protein MtrunA17_Chr3g0099701 [Medicago truncatula]